MKIKAQKLKKQLMLEAAITLCVLTLAAAGTYFVDSSDDAYSSQKTALEGQVSAVTNETNNLREKYLRIQKDKDLYQRVMEMTANDTLSTNIDLADSQMWNYKKAFSFDKLTLKYGDPVVLEDPKYKRQTTVIAARDSQVTFEGMLDEDVYELVRRMAKDFPGAVIVKHLVVSRSGVLSNESLRTITETGKFTLITGQVGFSWLGLQSSDPEVAKKAAARGRRP